MLTRRSWIVASLVGMTLPTVARASAPLGFDVLVVFGDSLSDGGNAGRFSDGPVWVEQLAVRLGLELTPSRTGGQNHAVGGARLERGSGPNSVRAQVDRFLLTPLPAGRALYIVYGGGNDVLAAVGRSDGPAVVDRAVASLRDMLEDLAGKGAVDVLVPNLPDVGITPAIRSQGSRAIEQGRELSIRFNAALDRILADVAVKSGRQVRKLDIWAMAERAKADPSAFGFVDIVRPCRGLPTCRGHLFWDDVHPTTSAHSRLAERAYELIAS